MKIGVLAGILEKTAEELVSDLKLETGVEEVTSEVAQKQINDHIANVKIISEESGRKKEKGKAERMHKSATEKALRNLGIEGEKYDDLFVNLKTKLEAEPDDKNKDLFEVNKALKKQVGALEKKISDRDAADALAIQKTKTRKKVISNITDTLKEFDFPSNEAKEMAIDNFIKDNEFAEIDDDSFYLKKGDKVVTDFSDDARAYFSLFGTKVDSKKKIKKIDDDDNLSYKGKTLSELNKIFIITKDPKEREKLRIKMRELQEKAS